MSDNLLQSGEPWLPFIATAFLQSFGMKKVFEWGMGGSTIFFAKMGWQVTSIEHDAEWYQKVVNELGKREVTWTDCHLIPFESGELGPDKANPSHYKSGSTELGQVNFRKYAAFIDQFKEFSLILVDGRARPSCLAHAIPKLKPGCWLVLDNSERSYYLEQTKHLFEGWETIDFYGYGPKLDYPWHTMFFRKPVR